MSWKRRSKKRKDPKRKRKRKIDELGTAAAAARGRGPDLVRTERRRVGPGLGLRQQGKDGRERKTERRETSIGGDTLAVSRTHPVQE